MDKIKNYIESMKKNGKSDQEIKDSLKSVGWKEEDINKFFVDTPLPPVKEFEEKGPYQLDKNFKILYAIRRMPFFVYLMTFILPLSIIFLFRYWYILVLSFAVLFFIATWFIGGLAHKYYKYSLKKNGFYKEYGIISKKFVTIPYDKIQNIDIRQTLLERILGLHYVMIQTAGNSGISRSEGYLPGLDKQTAESLRDELLDLSSLR